ncbi:MAG: cytochrome c biogenesis protein CcdA [Candidatus Eiseniibacteriota bacterium]|nr:MAG: cytochrome c biogenesis protein CcdA [Candidatus Eisenbacteria bacterium]
MGGRVLEEVSLLAAFGAGFLSFISPCVLPLVPGYISFISGVSLEAMREESGEGRTGSGSLSKIVPNSLLFILGFSVVFVALGASATFLGQFLVDKLSILSKIAGVVVIVFGLHVMGVFRIRFLQYERRFHARSKPLGLLGSFLVGLAFAFGWTPCIGPILGAILAFASTQETVKEGIYLLSAYSLGLGLPFFATGLAMNSFLGISKSIKAHFRTVEIVSGLLLVAVGILILTNSLQRLGFMLPFGQ